MNGKNGIKEGLRKNKWMPIFTGMTDFILLGLDCFPCRRVNGLRCFKAFGSRRQGRNDASFSFPLRLHDDEAACL